MALPLLISPEQLATHLDDKNLLIIDLSAPETYAQGHVPGAINTSPGNLMLGQQPVPNKLPTEQQLSVFFSDLGLTPDTQVVTYDDQMGPWAGRFVWALNCAGHEKASVLHGQLNAWKAAGLPLETKFNHPEPSQYQAHIDHSLVANLDDIQAHLGDTDRIIWDARTPAEYRGEKVVNTAKGGHIPGAVNLEWTETFISPEDLRLKDLDELRSRLESLGITPDKQVITHCQTHRRSGHTYLVLKALGYPRIQCYDGSWFEWGNHPDTPVTTD